MIVFHYDGDVTVVVDAVIAIIVFSWLLLYRSRRYRCSNTFDVLIRDPLNQRRFLYRHRPRSTTVVPLGNHCMTAVGASFPSQH